LVLRKDLLERCPDNLPDVMNYRLVAAKNSMLNTPPVFPIYMVGLVAKHLLNLGGLTAVADINQAKADAVYSAIDGSGGYYTGHAQEHSRSQMNVTFRTGSTELDQRFVAEATAAGMTGLKGHRSVGGLRASIYNAVPLASVQTLTEFMAEFARKNG
jgi:phosphoserine aminotransferase